MASKIRIEIGPGELIDRITILRIKVGCIDAPRRAGAEAQLAQLETLWLAQPVTADVDTLVAELAAVNARLWQLEDKLRGCEARSDFGADFVADAREVYRENDRRAALKAAIDRALGSAPGDPKVYAAHPPATAQAR